MPDAAEITRRSNSNLAFALRILPQKQRADMVVFYAFCRTMDDLADDSKLTVDERSAIMDEWQRGLEAGEFGHPTTLQRQVLEMRDRRGIPNELLMAIIDGCRMDLTPRRFATWEELSGYIWKVSCAVGLVSIRLFGCQDPAAGRYAVALGHALQLTNILRDIGEDLNNGGRVYLPLEDLAQFGYSEDDLKARVHDERFIRLMDFEADRAEGFYREAAELMPASDRHALRPARIMGCIYHRLLVVMRRDGFPVFETRCRVSRIRKLAILVRHLIGG